MSIATAQSNSSESLAQLVSHAAARESAMFTEAEGKGLLSSFGIDTPRGAALQLGAPVPSELRDPLVVKAVSATLVHKSDAGGVKVNVTAQQLPQITEDMRASLAAAGHELEGVLVEEMIPAGHEVIVGAVRTPGLGWTVMVGLGGVLVEVFEDVSFGLAPLDERQIADMLGELKGLKVLNGARGGLKANIPALVELIGRLAGPQGLLARLPDEVLEIDLNPVIVSENRAVAVDARFVVGAPQEAPRSQGSQAATDFSALIRPQRIAVLGASGKKPNMANRFIRNITDGGFDGEIIPVNPTADTIEGLPAVNSLADLTEPADYAFVALPAGRVASSLAAGAGKLRFAQVISSGFSEVAEGRELETELIRTVKDAGIRLIGPNCLGTHSSPGRYSFLPQAPLREGGTAVVSQSGGLSVDILRMGAANGIGFHSVVSVGNSADITAGELLRSHLQDDEVTVIGLYLESLGIAREVLDVLAQAPVRKPVVLLAGGRTSGGSRAATSHTGALAGNHRLWPAIARQAGITLVDSLADFTSALHALSTLDLSVKPQNTDAVLFGNGGGASVLGADALSRQNVGTTPLPEAVIEKLESLEVPPGNGFHNPIDVPAGTLAVKKGHIAQDILGTVLAGAEPAVLITHLNVGIIQRNLGATLGDVTGNIIDSIAAARDASESNTHQILVLKTDGSEETEDMISGYAQRARAIGIPVFDTFEDAALATRAVLEQSEHIHQLADAPEGK